MKHEKKRTPCRWDATDGGVLAQFFDTPAILPCQEGPPQEKESSRCRRDPPPRTVPVLLKWQDPQREANQAGLKQTGAPKGHSSFLGKANETEAKTG